MANRWTEEEKLHLKQIYPKLTNKQIAEILGCSTKDINKIAVEMKLKKEEKWLSSQIKTRRRKMAGLNEDFFQEQEDLKIYIMKMDKFNLWILMMVLFGM